MERSTALILFLGPPPVTKSSDFAESNLDAISSYEKDKFVKAILDILNCGDNLRRGVSNSDDGYIISITKPAR